MDELPDNELVQKYLQGDNKALEFLIERYFRQIFLFCKTYVKQEPEAEEMAQEVFVKLWKNIKKFDSQKKFKTWLFQIAKNTCIDFLRKHKNLLAAESLSEEQMGNELAGIVDQAPLPEELFDSQGFNQKLESILNTLPDIYKLTVTLHLQHDLTFQEISELLNEPINTIKSRYRRGILFIRKDFG